MEKNILTLRSDQSRVYFEWYFQYNIKKHNSLTIYSTNNGYLEREINNCILYTCLDKIYRHLIVLLSNHSQIYCIFRLLGKTQ